jgi:hypothetical protein
VWADRSCPVGRHGDAGWSDRTCTRGRCEARVAAAIGVRRFDRAHQRVDLSQSIQLPSLIMAEERAIVRAIRTQDRFAHVVRAPTGDPRSRTWQPIAGCPGDNTRQTQTSPPRRGQARRQGGPPTTMFVVFVQDTRSDSPCRMGIIRPIEGRGTASSSLLEACRRIQPQRGHLCGWPEHNYFVPRACTLW